MDQKLTFNQTVREAISLSLIQLMKNKPFSQITIIEIAKKAGVNRSTIYRNFQSKEELVSSYIHDLYQDYFRTHNIPQHFPSSSEMKQFLLPRFTFIKENQDVFSILYKQNMLFYIFEQMSPELILLLSGQETYISSYYVAMFSGAYASIINRWITNNFRESVEEMVEIFSSYPS